MKAVLLAGGYGTRLRPLTQSIPKCLVSIAGKPLLEIWLDTLVEAGITEFLINTHYLKEQVEQFVKQSKYKNKISLVYEKELLGTGGTLLKNRDFFQTNEAFMVVHADNLSICDYKDFISAHFLKPNSSLMSMMLFHANNPQECGVVTLDTRGVVQEFYEKVHYPPSNLANGAVYIFDYEMLSLLDSFHKKQIDISTEVLPQLLGQISTYLNTYIHIDVGTYKNYEYANEQYKKHLNNSKYCYFKRYFNKKNLNNFTNKIEEIHSRIKEQKKDLYKKKRVLAIYDCIDLPLSNDITSFIIGSEIERRKYKLEKIDLLFVVHANDPSPLRHKYVTSSNAKQFVYNMAIEQSRLFEHIGSLFVFDNRNEFLDFYKNSKKNYLIYPQDYNAKLPIEAINQRSSIHEWSNLAPYLKQDASLLCLTPPSDQVALVRKWIYKNIYPKIPITITLREWDNWDDGRNSKIKEWQKLIDFYAKEQKFTFIIIRDYYKLYDEKDCLNGLNLIYCNEAALSNSFRAALYQEVTLNLFVSNGSTIAAIANINVRYLLFSIYSNSSRSSREVLRDVLNLYYSDSFQGATAYQKVIWKRDTFDVLKEQTQKMLLRIESDFGLEPIFYNKTTPIKPTNRKTTPYKDRVVQKRENLEYYIRFFYFFKFIDYVKESLFNLKFKKLAVLSLVNSDLFHSKKRENECKYLIDYIFDIKSNNKKVIIYGSGTIGLKLYALLKKNIVCYVDQKDSSVDKLLEPSLEYDFIIITPQGRELEISTNLVNNYALKREKIIFF